MDNSLSALRDTRTPLLIRLVCTSQSCMSLRGYFELPTDSQLECGLCVLGPPLPLMSYIHGVRAVDVNCRNWPSHWPTIKRMRALALLIHVLIALNLKPDVTDKASA